MQVIKNMTTGQYMNSVGFWDTLDNAVPRKQIPTSMRGNDHIKLVTIKQTREEVPDLFTVKCGDYWARRRDHLGHPCGFDWIVTDAHTLSTNYHFTEEEVQRISMLTPKPVVTDRV